MKTQTPYLAACNNSSINNNRYLKTINNNKPTTTTQIHAEMACLSAQGWVVMAAEFWRAMAVIL